MQAEFAQLMQQSLQNPRAAARHLLNRQLPISTAWLAIALMAVISAGLSGVSILVAPAQIDPNEIDPIMLAMFKNPLQMAGLQGLVMIVMAMLAQGVGRMFGGQGRFGDALVLVAWTEALILVLQLAQIIVIVVSPTLAVALGMFGIVLFLWILASFIAEMHRFASTGKVLLGIGATVLAVAFAMAVVTVALAEMKG